MKERLPALIALFMLLCLVITTWWAADYAQRSIPLDPPARISHEPDAWSDRFIMLSSDPDGVPKNRLEGDSMQHFPHNDSYEIVNAISTGQRPGSAITTGRADHATMFNNDKTILMRGNAHLHRFPSEDTSALDITSSELIIYPEKDIIETDKPATVIQGNSRMNGKGMTYNNKTRELEVYANTDVSISSKDLPSKSSNTDQAPEENTRP